ncbi:hypothetical protein [uncultured Roseovarius sp.]|uniref:hypothetical protein n=1 Tax=uncultured Roseovarius sp. TaxID=293344 RepID=UPI00261802F9|nr:hypothetical protein [uncultured Roseovarius sp.]
MTVNINLELTARAHLASSTRKVHDALHKDPLLSKLTSPNLTAKEYYAALAAFGAFYFAIESERKRIGVFEQFSLYRECEALTRDLNPPFPSQPMIYLANESELLGALYVAHGATFGRNTFRANVLKAMPGRQHQFISLQIVPNLWRELVDKLESHCKPEGALEQMTAGAERSFSYMQAACIRSRQNG